MESLRLSETGVPKRTGAKSTIETQTRPASVQGVSKTTTESMGPSGFALMLRDYSVRAERQGREYVDAPTSDAIGGDDPEYPRCS